jgi:hypothetical protein
MRPLKALPPLLTLCALATLACGRADTARGRGPSTDPRAPQSENTPPTNTSLDRCYALEWQDPAWSSIIPDSVLLGSGTDSGLVQGISGPFPLRPIRPADSTKSTWRQLISARWYATGSDSLLLGFSAANANWGAHFSVRGDTLIGLMLFSGFDMDGSMPSPAIGMRFRCPG